MVRAVGRGYPGRPSCSTASSASSPFPRPPSPFILHRMPWRLAASRSVSSDALASPAFSCAGARPSPSRCDPISPASASAFQPIRPLLPRRDLIRLTDALGQPFLLGRLLSPPRPPRCRCVGFLLSELPPPAAAGCLFLGLSLARRLSPPAWPALRTQPLPPPLSERRLPVLRFFGEAAASLQPWPFLGRFLGGTQAAASASLPSACVESNLGAFVLNRRDARHQTPSG